MTIRGSRYEDADIVYVPVSDGTKQLSIFPDNPYEYEFNYDIYRFQEGDRLDVLAARFFGDSRKWWRIPAANPSIGYSDEIPAGTLLRIPTGDVR